MKRKKKPREQRKSSRSNILMKVVSSEVPSHYVDRPIRTVLVTADNRFIISAERSSPSVKVFDFHTQQEVYDFKTADQSEFLL